MSYLKIVSELDSYLESSGKRKEALKNLLINGRISQSTFETMDEKLNHLTLVVSDLKNTLEVEETYWKTSLPASIRILESLLVELELKHTLGEVNEKEWENKSRIIISGLDSLKSKTTQSSKAELNSLPPVQAILVEHAVVKTEPSFEPEIKEDISRSPSKSRKEPRHAIEEDTAITHPIVRQKKRITKELPELEGTGISKAHCMNPWKPECRDTDIELSIYYNDCVTPICRKCWEDISKRNVEWSSL